MVPQQPVSQVSAVHCSLLVLLLLPSVASPPTNVTASRITPTAANVIWSAPSPSPAGYEVFYHASTDNIGVSAVNTTNTSYMLSGLTLGVSYSVFVLSYGAVGAPVLPSALINAIVTSESLDVIYISCFYYYYFCTGTPQLPANLMLTSNSSTLFVSWAGPPSYTPDSYNISYSCQRLCDSNMDVITTTGTNVSTTSQVTIAPGTSCTVSVTAMFGSFSSNTISSSINTISEGIMQCNRSKCNNYVLLCSSY